MVPLWNTMKNGFMKETLSGYTCHLPIIADDLIGPICHNNLAYPP
jgi:hypothetical protein